MSGATVASGSHYSAGVGLQDMSPLVDGGGHSWGVHLCAHPGSNPDTATPMRACLNFVDDVRNPGDSVSLPPATGGQILYVLNRTDNGCSVYTAPNTTDTIYSASATSAFAVMTLPGRTGALYMSVPGEWSVSSSSPESGGGGVVGEAPQDGFGYVRYMAGWANADSRYTTQTYVDGAVAGLAPLNSPAFTGTPAALTPPAGSNSAQLATTMYADRAASAVAASIPVASSTIPLMSGSAAVGTGITWARADHVHPVDASRYAASNPAAYVSAAGAAAAAPVQSVATRTGSIVLSHSDITDWAVQLAPYLLRAGTITNDNAPAGIIGEFMSVQRPSTSPLSVTSGTSLVVQSLTLTAGDWDVWGAVGFNLNVGGQQSVVRGWINMGGSTMPSIDQMGGNAIRNVPADSTQALLPVTPLRVSLAGSVAVSIGALATFNSGTVAAFGQLMARRAR